MCCSYDWKRQGDYNIYNYGAITRADFKKQPVSVYIVELYIWYDLDCYGFDRLILFN